MDLTIHLTDTEYTALMAALKHATYAITPRVNDTDQLELLHLMTLLAQAAQPTTPPIRNKHGDELTNYTDQIKYGVSQDAIKEER